MDHRLVLLFGSTDDPRVEEQLAELSSDLDGARERDVGFVEVERMPQASEFRDMAGLAEGEFGVVVVGKDGQEAHRASEVEPVAALWRKIDASRDTG